MCSPLLPRTTKIRHAAILSGRSIAGFTRDVLPGVWTLGGRVDTTKLEMAIGVELTPSMWLAADRRLGAARRTLR